MNMQTWNIYLIASEGVAVFIMSYVFLVVFRANLHSGWWTECFAVGIVSAFLGAILGFDKFGLPGLSVTLIGIPMGMLANYYLNERKEKILSPKFLRDGLTFILFLGMIYPIAIAFYQQSQAVGLWQALGRNTCLAIYAAVLTYFAADVIVVCAAALEDMLLILLRMLYTAFIAAPAAAARYLAKRFSAK
jgi:hypothetical protein